MKTLLKSPKPLSIAKIRTTSKPTGILDSVPTSTDAIIFEVTSSTNFPGSKMTIRRDGHVEVESGPRNSIKKLQFLAPNDLVTRTFEALQRAWPLRASGTAAIKSISFGCYSYLIYGGLKSPDLDACIKDSALKALLSDLTRIRTYDNGLPD